MLGTSLICLYVVFGQGDDPLRFPAKRNENHILSSQVVSLPLQSRNTGGC